MLKVLFQTRWDVFQHRGGDTVQIEATRKYLERLGVHVEFDPSCRLDLSGYDIIHLFNTIRPGPTLLQLRNARRQRKPTCLSTIYMNLDVVSQEDAHYARADTVRWREHAEYWVRRLLSPVHHNSLLASFDRGMVLSRRRFLAGQAELLQGADMLLPDCEAEREEICRDFPFARSKPWALVHYCVDPEVFGDADVSARDWGRSNGLREFVLCAGAIQPRKNQLRLVRAMANTSIPVVLVGVPHTAYTADVRRAMKPSDRIVEHVDHATLRRLYASARVHALPSRCDVPGVVSLEAGYLGCNVVVTDAPCQREYLGGLAEYCDPSDVESIRAAVLRAWEREWPCRALPGYIRERYVWEVAARQTLTAYEQLLCPSRK